MKITIAVKNAINKCKEIYGAIDYVMHKEKYENERYLSYVGNFAYTLAKACRYKQNASTITKLIVKRQRLLATAEKFVFKYNHGDINVYFNTDNYTTAEENCLIAVREYIRNTTFSESLVGLRELCYGRLYSDNELVFDEKWCKLISYEFAKQTYTFTYNRRNTK